MRVNEETIDFACSPQIQIRLSRKLPPAAMQQIIDKVRRMTHVAIEQLVPVIDEARVQPPDGSYVVVLSFANPAAPDQQPSVIVPPVPNLAAVPDAPAKQAADGGDQP